MNAVDALFNPDLDASQLGRETRVPIGRSVRFIVRATLRTRRIELDVA